MTQITVDQNNARSHPERNRKAIRASLERFGPARSIVVDKDGVIRAGNGTYEAAQELGLKTTIVDVEDGELVAIRRNDWTEDEAKAYAIADNRTTDLSEWRAETLDATFRDLPKDLIAPLDFRDKELAQIIPPTISEGNTDPDEIPDEVETITKPGDLWRLGEHRLLCGDCTMDSAIVFQKDRADLVVTSPPYNQGVGTFSKSGMHRETKWVDNTNKGSYPDRMAEDEYQAFQIKAIDSWRPYLTATASIFYNHKNRFRDKSVVSPWRWLERTGATVRQEIIWLREGSVTQNMRGFMPVDERIFWLYFGDDFTWVDTTENKKFSTVWKINSHKDRVKSEHGCAYPCEIPRRAMVACSHPEQIVFEPFCGSGTTIIAAEQLNRRCYAMEIAPKYCDVAVRRWENFTGKKAVRE